MVSGFKSFFSNKYTYIRGGLILALAYGLQYGYKWRLVETIRSNLVITDTAWHAATGSVINKILRNPEELPWYLFWPFSDWEVFLLSVTMAYLIMWTFVYVLGAKKSFKEEYEHQIKNYKNQIKDYKKEVIDQEQTKEKLNNEVEFKTTEIKDLSEKISQLIKENATMKYRQEKEIKTMKESYIKELTRIQLEKSDQAVQSANNEDDDPNAI